MQNGINWLVFLFLLFSPAKAESDYIFEHLSTESGLSHSSVSVMLKDHRGFMWFATWDGINRFDGEKFVTFKPDNGDGAVVASNRIEKMKEDAFGNIWIVTSDARAFRLNKFTESFESVPASMDGTGFAQVNDIYTTNKGDVWVSTNNFGAYRVRTNSTSNKISIVHYSPEGENNVVGNQIYFVREDAVGNIWINSNKGLTYLEASALDNKMHLKLLSDEANVLLSSAQITATYSSSTHFYFGTQNGYLLAFDIAKNTVHPIFIEDQSSVTNISSDGKGILFVGTKNNGVFEFDERKQKTVRHFDHPDINQVLKSFYFKGMLWVETTDAGISKIDLQTGKVRRYTQQLDVSSDVRPYAQCGLMVDENQTLWLTLKGGGFGFYNEAKDEVEYFFNKPGDPQRRVSNFVNCFYKDSTGVLWMSTYFKGVEKVTFTERYFRWVEPAPQMDLSTSNEVRALLEDSHGLLWVATKNQEIFLLDEDFHVLKSFTHFAEKRIGRVYALMEDSKGVIYLGTKGNGLFQLHRKGKEEFTATHYSHDPTNPFSISNDNIYSILEDRDGTVWIGTYGGGINIFKEKKFYHSGNQLKNYPKMAGEKVRHIIQDRDGSVWVASTDGLLLVDSIPTIVDNTLFHLYNRESSNVTGMRSNDIFWLLNDKQNNIWMASLGGGLAKFKKESPHKNKQLDFTTFTKKDGLSSDVIFTMMDDENGNIWMATENGITSFSPDSNSFKNYQQFDGILHPAFSEGALAVRTNGAFCFGANNGLYSFHPSSFEVTKKRADIIFTGFQLFGKEVTPNDNSVLHCSITEIKSVMLKHNQNVFSISWAGLDFNSQHKMQYACKLEGYDMNWRDLKDRSSVDYHRIPPGKYIFCVKFTNSELKEKSETAFLSVEILPPFWKTNWAYLIYFLLLVVLLEFARRVITTVLKLRNKIEIEKGLTEAKLSFFTNVSHELRTPLTLMLGPVEEIKQKEPLTEKGKIYVNLIETNAHRLLRLVNQLLDFRKIQSNAVSLNLNQVDLISFLQSICVGFEEKADHKKIHFSFETQLSSLVVPIDVEKLESVMINLLSNAFKFTEENGSIKVRLFQPTTDEVVVEVIDNGVGIPKRQESQLFEMFSSHYPEMDSQPTGSGIGLALAKELMQTHKGELFYRPTVGGGATFSIHLDLRLLLQLISVDESAIANNDLPIVNSEETFLENVSSSRSRLKILVVEDNAELRHFLHLQLSDEYEVLEAKDGVDGLQEALDKQPNIILSDVMMPRMDGIQLLESIKNNFETSHIPVVLLTAKSSVESRIEGLKYGADAYLTKPFNTKELKLQLRNLLHSRSLILERFMHNSSNEQAVLVDGVTQKDIQFLNQVREIIEANLINSDFKLEDLYKEIGMGRSKFSDKINGLTGLSPISFINEYKLNKAQMLLRAGEHTISEVSFLSGFSDAGYFSKCFKDRFGVAPSHFSSMKE